KNTCKDRWRQVLSEAERVKFKHLLTLEPGISENQTNQMKRSKLQLVVPLALHRTYKTEQQTWLLSFDDFIRLLIARQS
ncbi:MAG: type II restriction endonuclease, partial [Trichlorobacter sp.]|uniref:type II restriction endonuclease n=1 Tax=Trichlorobacter sp. TaxID=2911007 RepID=UPI0025612E3C